MKMGSHNLVLHAVRAVSAAAGLLSLLLAASGECQTPHEPTAQAVQKADSLYAQGMSELQKGDLAAARSAFEKVVLTLPASAEAHNALGFVLLTQGDLASALGQLQTAARLKPDFAQAHLNLSNAYLQQGATA